MAMARWVTCLALALPAVLIALGWATLPSVDGPAETFRSHASLLLHVMGLAAPSREGRYGTRDPPAPRAANGSIPEVHGFVSPETFRADFLWKRPVVFRGAATVEHGFDLGCLTRGGRSPQQGLAEELSGRKIRIFRDQYDDASAEYMTAEQYQSLAEEAAVNSSRATPYPRAFPQSAMHSCALVPSKRMRSYRGWAGWAAQTFLPEPDTSVVFASFNEGTNTKMHIDIGDSFFTQVHGRKRWLFVEPEYVSQMHVHGDRLNLVYISAFDVHREPVPSDIPIKEVILHPGDIVYFPPMTFHAVYNLDPVTVGVDNAAFDPAGGLVRHWFLAVATLFNPWTVVKAVSIFWRTGSFTCTELYFDGFSQSEQKRKALQP